MFLGWVTVISVFFIIYNRQYVCILFCWCDHGSVGEFAPFARNIQHISIRKSLGNYRIQISHKLFIFCTIMGKNTHGWLSMQAFGFQLTRLEGIQWHFATHHKYNWFYKLFPIANGIRNTHSFCICTSLSVFRPWCRRGMLCSRTKLCVGVIVMKFL